MTSKWAHGPEDPGSVKGQSTTEIGHSFRAIINVGSNLRLKFSHGCSLRPLPELGGFGDGIFFARLIEM